MKDNDKDDKKLKHTTKPLNGIKEIKNVKNMLDTLSKPKKA